MTERARRPSYGLRVHIILWMQCTTRRTHRTHRASAIGSFTGTITNSPVSPGRRIGFTAST